MLKIGTKWEKNEQLSHRHKYHNPHSPKSYTLSHTYVGNK